MDDSVVGELKSGYRRVNKPYSSTLSNIVLAAYKPAQVGVSASRAFRQPHPQAAT